ncbi:MAG: hypothetical protein J5517_05630 [Eubacterium sp.]|nr:hypothetical protein [Eubacterium sp.]
MESILTTEKGTCYLCQRRTFTQLHHIIHTGVPKKKQDKMGLVVYLCLDCHTGTNGVHGKNGAERDHDLKALAQARWEINYIRDYPYQYHAREAAREEWMKQIGESFIN